MNKEWEELREQARKLLAEFGEDRTKTLDLLVNMQKDDPKTFELARRIYAVFSVKLESLGDPGKDAIIETLAIATILKEHNGKGA